MYTLQKLNLVRVVDTESKMKKLIKAGYSLVEDTTVKTDNSTTNVEVNTAETVTEEKAKTTKK